MSKNYCYSVQINNAESPVTFGYDDSGVLPELSGGSLFGGFNLSAFGEDGSCLYIGFDIPIGIQGATWNVHLVFEEKIDFTKPLPLDKFSAENSSYEYTAGIPGGQPQTLPVQAVTAMTCPPEPET